VLAVLFSFLLVFREVLEATLIVGVILGYLRRTDRGTLSRYVWVGVGGGVAASVAGAFAFEYLSGGFEGRAEELFEAVTMLVGATLLTTAIVWLARAARRTDVERAVEASLSDRGKGSARGGLALLAGVSVLREGIELVIFLAAAGGGTGSGSLAGALLGFAAAVALGFAVFSAAIRVNLRAFFGATNVLLVLFAAGLVARGLHELAEAGVLPAIVDPVWNVNPPARADGSVAAFHENGAVGGILKGLFGWNGDPSALEVIGWGAYLAAAAAIAIIRGRRAAPPRGPAALPNDSAA
jgi:high-affinity iron transporter